MKINRADPGMLLSLLKEAYHILLSSITITFSTSYYMNMDTDSQQKPKKNKQNN